jgi:hypothetical protein
MMMEGVQTSEPLVNSYHSTWRYNPEESHLQNTDLLLTNNMHIIMPGDIINAKRSEWNVTTNN